MYGLILLIIVGIAFIFIGDSNLIDSDVWAILILCIGIFTLLMSPVVAFIIYDTTTNIEVSQIAEDLCQQQGYDTFESWQGYGIFPDYPDVLKCKYFDNNVEIRNGAKLV